MLLNLDPNDTDEPTPDDLAAIDAEQPLRAAELAWFAAEVAMLNADERGGPTPLDWRRLRRAERRVIRETFAHVARRTARSGSRRAA